MEDSNWIDKLFRSKLQERDFEADDASWEDALALIEKNERATRSRYWGFGLSSVLVVGLISFFVWNSNTEKSQLAENTSSTEDTMQQGETAPNANKTYTEENKNNKELGKNESTQQSSSDDATRMERATNNEATEAIERNAAVSSSFNERANTGSKPNAGSPKVDAPSPESSPRSERAAASQDAPAKGRKAGSTDTRARGLASVGTTNTQKKHSNNSASTDTQATQTSTNTTGNTSTKPTGNSSETDTQTQQASRSSSGDTPTKPVGKASVTNTQTQQANNTTGNDPSKPAGNTSETATESQHASTSTTEGAQPSNPDPAGTSDSNTDQARATTSSTEENAKDENAEPTNSSDENEEESSNTTPTSPAQNTAVATPLPPATSLPTTVPDSPALADQFMHAKFGAHTSAQSISGGKAASIVEDGASSAITPAIAFEYFRKAGRFHVGSGLHYTSSKLELNIPERSSKTFTFEDSVFAIVDSMWTVDSNQVGQWVPFSSTDTITLADSLFTLVAGTKTTIIQSHIRIPILFAYRKQYGRLTLGVDVGPTLNILSGQKGVYPTADLSANAAIATEHFRKLSIGYMLRPSIHYTLTDRLSIGIEPYLYGQFQSSAKVDPINDQRFSNYGLGFGLAYSLGGGTAVTP